MFRIGGIFGIHRMLRIYGIFGIHRMLRIGGIFGIHRMLKKGGIFGIGKRKIKIENIFMSEIEFGECERAADL